jgi:hypothetical protein
MKLLPIIALYAVISGAGAGCARTPASTAGIAGPKPIVTPAAKPTLLHKAKISKVCSEQADAKNLHGKERKTFRVECMRSGGSSF